ncbi:MAG: polysaccharide lyase family 7 protein [Candidatus Levybacteria bacterium]|nr:polysaccharide lyase family 7 protein [Candidatus Levybacteria bacterium]
MHLRRRQLYTIIFIEAVLIGVVSLTLFFHMIKPQSPLGMATTPTLSNGSETPTGNVTAVPSQSTTPSSLKPAKVLNLTNWKITLPIGSDEKPTEVKQPVLTTYELNPWFVSIDNGKAVRFRAPVSSVTTSGSNYPRSELREMTNNGTQQASWSSSTGIHTMTVDQAITAVPTTKKHVVAGQIHDADDDVIVIRLEYPKLYVNVDGDNVVTLEENYQLGKRFTVKFVAQNGQTKVYYNGNTTPAYTLTKDYIGAYFKAGAYTQSNCNREGQTSLCNDNNYGEVVIYDVDVTHR